MEPSKASGQTSQGVSARRREQGESSESSPVTQATTEVTGTLLSSQTPQQPLQRRTHGSIPLTKRQLTAVVEEDKPIGTKDQANSMIIEFEVLTEPVTVKLNQPLPITQSYRMPFQSYIKWLSRIIPCYIICDKIKTAEDHVDFALRAIDSTKKKTIYSDSITGILHYSKFHILSIKHTKTEEQASPQEFQTSGSTERALTLQEEMIYHLEVAIRSNNDCALLAGIVYNLNTENDLFTANPPRAMALIDRIIKDVHSKKQRLKARSDQRTTSDIEFFIMHMVEHIKRIKDILESGSRQKDKVLEMWEPSGLAPYTRKTTHLLNYFRNRKYPYVNFLSGSEEPNILFYTHMNSRKLLTNYIRVCHPIFLYVLSKEDESQYLGLIEIIKEQMQVAGESQQTIRSRFFKNCPQYQWNSKPSGDLEGVYEHDPELSPSMVDYIHIKYMLDNKKWTDLTTYCDRIIKETGGNLPLYIRALYKDVLIHTNRFFEALIQLQILGEEYEQKQMYYELAMIKYDIEDMETQLIDTTDFDEMEVSAKHQEQPSPEDKPAVHTPFAAEAASTDVEEQLLHSLEKTTLETETTERGKLPHFVEHPEEQSTEGHTAIQASATTETLSTTGWEAEPLMPGHAETSSATDTSKFLKTLSKASQATVPESKKSRHDKPAGKSVRRKRPIPTPSYRDVCRSIRQKMADDSPLESIVSLINEALEKSQLTVIQRGRLYWRLGWAYKSRAHTMKERAKAYDYFGKALACAVSELSGQPREKNIDPVLFLKDEMLSACYYRKSYKNPAISLIADVYSSSGNYFRDMNKPDIGSECTHVADTIKWWRKLRRLPSYFQHKPKVKLTKKDPA